jgi:tRNA dimethylallyltransferase
MVENGLLDEIAELRGIAKEIYGEGADHTEGIFQSIGEYVRQTQLTKGYKEFSGLDLDQENPSFDPAFGPMLDRMKLSTHQYARSQIKWIKKQLLPAGKEAKSLGGDVQVYVVRGGEEGYVPSIQLLHRESPSWSVLTL